MVKLGRDFLRLRHAKAHDDGTLKNPLFIKPKKPLWIFWAFFSAGILATIGLFIGLTHLPMFQVHSITINGVVTLNQNHLQDIARESLHRSWCIGCSKTNLYLPNKATITEALLNSGGIEQVEVTRQNQELIINLEEKITTIALRTKEKTAMLDVDGKYVRDATTEESRAIDLRLGTAVAQDQEAIFPLQTDMPIIINTQNETTTEFSALLAERFLELSDELPRAGFHAISYSVDGLAAPFVRINTTANFDLLVDLYQRTVDEQIDSLQAIISDEKYVEPKEYIDLRFGAYVYFK